MSTDNKITIITVCRNAASVLERTIESVVWQDYANIEYIIKDGASTDSSQDIIKRYEQKISFWASTPDNGIYDAMNIALKHAHGDYVLFLNAGDWLCDSQVISCVFRTAHNEDLIMGRQRFADINGKSLGVAPRIYPDELNMEYFMSSTLPHQATFIRRSLFSEIGYYDTNYKVCADWVFWIEAVIKHQCSIETTLHHVSYMLEGGVSSNMDKCHADMQKYLETCLSDGTLTWNEIFTMAIHARQHNLATRNKIMSMCEKVLEWIGKRI